MRLAFALLISFSCFANAAEIEDEIKKSSEFVVRLGNESNPVDGFFGPFTYGAQGSHRFDGDSSISLGYMRLHEPSSSTLTSVLDEAQATVSLPVSSGTQAGLTGWQNRMIDMYTNLFGLEFSSGEVLSILFGMYAGSATREEVSGKFFGGQIAFQMEVSNLEFKLLCVLGTIDQGSYRRCEFGVSKDFLTRALFPVTTTLDVEERYFDFGVDRPKSEPQDEFIVVAAIEIHLEKLISHAQRTKAR